MTKFFLLMIPIVIALLALVAVSIDLKPKKNKHPNKSLQFVFRHAKNYIGQLAELGQMYERVLIEYYSHFRNVQKTLENTPIGEHQDDLKKIEDSYKKLVSFYKARIPNTLQALQSHGNASISHSEAREYSLYHILLGLYGESILGKSNQQLSLQIQKTPSLIWYLKHMKLIAIQSKKSSIWDKFLSPTPKKNDLDIMITQSTIDFIPDPFILFGLDVEPCFFDFMGQTDNHTLLQQKKLDIKIQSQITQLGEVTEATEQLILKLKQSITQLYKTSLISKDMSQFSEASLENYFLCCDLLIFLSNHLSPISINRHALLTTDAILRFKNIVDTEANLRTPNAINTTELDEKQWQNIEDITY